MDLVGGGEREVLDERILGFIWRKSSSDIVGQRERKRQTEEREREREQEGDRKMETVEEETS